MRKQQQQPVCTCQAYPFPHRRFGGKCDADTGIRRSFVPSLMRDTDYGVSRRGDFDAMSVEVVREYRL